jgi:prevent-host-death family protein
MKMPKVITATEVRKNWFQTLKEVAQGDPILITHKGGEPVVMISLKRYNELQEENEQLKRSQNETSKKI